MDAPSSADIRRWSQLTFAEYGFGADPFTGAVKETTLATAVTLPHGELSVVDGSVLAASGYVLVQHGSDYAIVKYTSISGNTLKGCTGGEGEFPEGSRVSEYKEDALDEQRDRAVSDYLHTTGYAFLDVTRTDRPRVRQAVQMLTEYKVVSGGEDVVETAGDFDMVGGFSAGSYSETRRQDNRRSLVLHPWPALNKLLWGLITADKLAEMGLADAPEVSELEDPADWRVAQNIMKLPAYQLEPPGGPFGPFG